MLEKASITYANAGHQPPVIRHADGSIEELDKPDLALGVISRSEYAEHTHSLESDDVVVMVTDGITEAETLLPLFSSAKMVYVPIPVREPVRPFQPNPVGSAGSGTLMEAEDCRMTPR